MADVPMHVVSENSSSERRITPAWTISQLRKRLEPITGIPPSAQSISIKTSTSAAVPVEAADEDAVQLSSFPLAPYAELQVSEASFFFLESIQKQLPGRCSG
jgi:tubulin-folding cofactor B